jgi:DNA uptake protein ComE-like DNA-binding protein
MRRLSILLVSLGVMILWGLLGLPAAQDAPKDGGVQGIGGDSQTPVKKVDLNLAGPEEMGRLPGITHQVAERIIRNRPYKKMDDLITRKVIGKKQFAQIREYIVVGSGQK